MLREALAICKEVGTQFCGPKVTSALRWAVQDPAERAALFRPGQGNARPRRRRHDHLWFYRDAIEAMLAAGEAANALAYLRRTLRTTCATCLFAVVQFVRRSRPRRCRGVARQRRLPRAP